MEKRGAVKTLSKEEIAFISQLISSLEQSLDNLEKSYKKNDYQVFSNSKTLMKSLSNKISENLK